MTVPSPTGAYLPLGPVPGRRQASRAAVSEGAAALPAGTQAKGGALDRVLSADARPDGRLYGRRPVSVGRGSASAPCLLVSRHPSSASRIGEVG